LIRTLIIYETKTLFHHIVSIPKCTAWYVNGQVKFCQGKYVIWYTCLADDLEKKPIWIPGLYDALELYKLLEIRRQL